MTNAKGKLNANERFTYYASAAVLLAVITQVGQADEVATQTPSVTEGNQCQPATGSEIFGGEAVLPATSSSSVSAPAATSKVAKASSLAVSTVSCFTEFRGCYGINFSNIFSC
ncbi:hypothetical protein GPU26_01640 [Streptococcus thermophilus]|nr:hypothetical protein [Streptococcus thermophilus]MCE2104762.1 hypothetical protein [Streptococcus thermophilus]